MIHFVTQDDCFKHVFRRSKDASTIFERPERLRFVNLGLAAALAWHSVHNPNTTIPPSLLAQPSLHQLETASDLQKNSLLSLVQTSQVTFSKSTRKILLHDPAFGRIHDQPNQSTNLSSSASPPPASSSKDPSTASALRFAAFEESTNYLGQLIGLCRRASELHHFGLSEVPEHLPQGDLYLSNGSESAILGAVGACYAAIDSILRAKDHQLEPQPASTSTGNHPESSQYSKAFVNIRPPGHHCTNSEPMGFCWANNVLVSSMYSYLTYGIDRISILDIDLHHGNGSQQIVWNLNTQAGLEWSEKLEKTAIKSENRSLDSSRRRPLKISYSSLHDVNSYPCEEGDPDRIKDASLNICVGKSINQFIQNLHIEDWSDEEDFYRRLYPKTWAAFEQHMLSFFQITDAHPDRSLIFISAGFDGCEYETGQMSRFAKNLPASFFNRFGRDVSRFADLHCNGRLVSVLEGGYSEQTLTGSCLSYMLGLMDHPASHTPLEDGTFPWSLARTNQLLKLCKKGDSTRKSQSSTKPTTPQESSSASGSKDQQWITETRRIFEHIDAYDQVKSEQNKSNRLEEKQIQLQHAISQLGLEARSPEGLRRSSRHASSTKKPEPTKAKSPTAPSSNQPPSALELLSGSNPGPSIRSPSRPPPQAAQPAGPDVKPEQIGTGANDHQAAAPTAGQQDRSIDNLFGRLNLDESPQPPQEKHSPKSDLGPPSSLDQSNSSSLDQSNSASTPATSLATEHSKLPKVKLVWKAGGVFGSGS